MTYRELPFKRTPIVYPTLVNTLLLEWPDHTPVTRRAVLAAAGQIGHETGVSHCYNWLISGIKATPNNGRTHWQYLSTRERLSPEAVERARQLMPGTIDIEGDGGGGLIWVRVRPRHPYCCFRAYESLEESVRDHIATLVRRFPRSWAAAQTGDAAAFANALKAERYYTGPEPDYARGMIYASKEAAAQVTEGIWGDVQ